MKISEIAIMDTEEWKEKYNKQAKLFNNLADEMRSKGINVSKLRYLVYAVQDVDNLFKYSIILSDGRNYSTLPGGTQDV